MVGGRLWLQAASIQMLCLALMLVKDFLLHYTSQVSTDFAVIFPKPAQLQRSKKDHSKARQAAYRKVWIALGSSTKIFLVPVHENIHTGTFINFQSKQTNKKHQTQKLNLEFEFRIISQCRKYKNTNFYCNSR